MKIQLSTVMVQDQQKAVEFYTKVLGFVVKHDIPMGEHRWLTVVSPGNEDGTELVLEPMAFAPAQVYQKALFDAGIPANAFVVSDIEAEYKRMQSLGVLFKGKPENFGPVTLVRFEDTCGNLLQIFQV
jgi:catechol 2,3-dioxygenase-like lactoylglutathione lyase family enzyme